MALGDFDKRMGQEQQDIEKSRQANGARGSGSASGASDDGKDGGGSGGGRGESGSGSTAGGASGMPGEIATGEGAGGQGQNSGGGGRGAPSAGPRFPAPQGTPDGKDDDVVARQLREAAEKEADPELRAKLWDEYRKYKSRK
ncbi:MAG: hypothetical protein ACT4P0_02765 [Panacagrimonas sp.]